MKAFTTTELKFNRPKVFNEVAENGAVLITHRDRPDMYLASQKYIAQVMADSYKKGQESVK